MIAKIITEHAEMRIKAESVKIEDGFLKFKNVSVDNSIIEEEAWIPSGACKCIVWEGKPEDVKEEKKE